MGSSSLAEMGLAAARLVVPSGARNGGRGLPSGFSRLSTLISCGVPTNIGLGSSISTGTSFTSEAGAGATSAGAGASAGVSTAAACSTSSAGWAGALSGGAGVSEGAGWGSSSLQEAPKHNTTTIAARSSAFVAEFNFFLISLTSITRNPKSFTLPRRFTCETLAALLDRNGYPTGRPFGCQVALDAILLQIFTSTWPKKKAHPAFAQPSKKQGPSLAESLHPKTLNRRTPASRPSQGRSSCSYASFWGVSC